MDIPLSRYQQKLLDQIQGNCGFPHSFSFDEILGEKSFSRFLLPFRRATRRTKVSQIRCCSLERILQLRPKPKPKPSNTGLNEGKEGPLNGTQFGKPSSELCAQIQELVSNKRYHEALELFENLKMMDVYVVDSETYDALVSACIELKSIRAVKILSSYMINSGFDPDEYLRNKVLLMHVKCGMMIDARRLFDEMPEKNLFSWNTIIGGLVDAGDYFEAFRLFLMMWQEFSDAGSRIFSMMMQASSGLGLIFPGRQLHACSLKIGVGGDVFVACALIDMYSKCGSIEDARCVFDRMPEKTTVAWNSIIAGYALHGYSEEALSLYYEMRDSGVKIDHYTFSIIISLCARLASLEHAKKAHADLVRHGFGLDIVANTALVDLYSKWGRMEDAKHVFDMMPRKNVKSWNALIGGYGKHGRGVEAIEMFEQMLHEGMVPNHVTFLAVLSACSYSGLSDRGWEIFESMSRDHKIKPRAMHYACMIELLGREGLLDEAFALIRDAPFSPTLNMWAALLTACRVHKNLELGKFVAEKIYGMGPEKLSNYVVLLNILNSSGKLEEANAVIENLKEKGLKMLPACSWIEINKQSYCFNSGDRCHGQSIEIYQKLNDLMLEISKQGYIPQETFLLPDVDEREERILLYHSEKLAIAFGLLNTSDWTPLQIVQSHRICDDCHNAIKLIALVTRREIVVRDASRFHHFKNGTCSCGDYW